MTCYPAIWIVLLLCCPLSLSKEAEEENGILVLTKENFEEVINNLEFVLVEFYAPWCGHCQALTPEYEKAAQILKAKESRVKLAKVDATVETDLGERYKVQGFPTLKFFKGGDDPIEYTGGRDASGIVAWLEKKTGPPCIQISNKKELDKLIEEEGIIVVGFFDDVASENGKLFERMAEQDDIRKYVVIMSRVIMKETKAKDSTIIVFKNFDEKQTEYSGEYKEEHLVKFIQQTSRPNIFEFSQENAEKIVQSGLENLLFILSDKQDKNHAERIKQATPVAKEFKEKVVFVHIDTKSDEFNDLIEHLGVKKDKDVPTFMIFNLEGSKKYHPENKNIKTGNLRIFIKDYLDGKLKPILKSAELPEDWDSKPVKVLVSSNFKKIALDVKKDVFVEFYAPWCGHCKNLAPIWEKLGEQFKDRSDLVIAKMDATENEVEEVEVEGFPTLKLFKKETNEIVDYTGGRDYDSLVRFIETGEQSEESEESDVEGGEDNNEEDEDYADYEDYEDEDDAKDQDERKKDEL